MSCNGCRVLRKGCSEDCMLRHCLMWIQSPQSQAHATLFVAKFFGRATLMSFLSSVPTTQRSELFQSLLYEAVGRTINPVNGAVGMLWTGNWHLCQLAVEQVLRGGGGALTPLPHFSTSTDDHHEAAFEEDYNCSSNNHQGMLIRRSDDDEDVDDETIKGQQQAKKQRAGILNEDDYSETATFRTSSSKEYYCASSQSETKKLLTLFL